MEWAQSNWLTPWGEVSFQDLMHLVWKQTVCVSSVEGEQDHIGLFSKFGVSFGSQMKRNFLSLFFIEPCHYLGLSCLGTDPGIFFHLVMYHPLRDGSLYFWERAAVSSVYFFPLLSREGGASLSHNI